jgi:predicted ATP-dependent endonuclease of OLD family
VTKRNLLTLIKAQVWKYKSIEDSMPVDIAEDVTVLVGKNESGKTAFLGALHKALPLDDETEYDHVADYPRKDLVRYQQQHEAKNYEQVVQLTFRIEEALADKINAEVFGGAQIVSAGSTFQRNTTIGNTHTYGFSVDQKAALAALRKPLSDLEHADNIFGESATLTEALASIEELKLPADNKLATFAAQWSGRQPEGTWELVTGHVWETYVAPALPKFLYFDDYKLLEGKINLQALKARFDSKRLTDADETALGLIELAGTSLQELSSDEGYENAKAKLEAIGASITDKIFEFWKQNRELDVEFDLKADPKDTPPFNAGFNLYVRIKNRRHRVTVSFDQRSKGFIWFFSFLVWFDAVQSRTATTDSLILLLDEPGLSLHALAQADFLAYIRDLSAKHQIIYTTHSPFMVDSERLADVRVVEDRANEGTKVTSELAGSSNESVFPLQAALGYSIAQNLFIAKQNLLVEGPADLILLQHMSALLEASGKQGLRDAILVPVGGLDKLATFVALLGSNKLQIVVLHDRASSPHQKLEDLVRQRLIERKRVLDFSMFIEPQPSEADIEDLVPQAAYIEAFNAAYAKELKGTTLKAKDLGNEPRIVARIDKWLAAKGMELLKDGGFNHYRVAQALLQSLKADSFTREELARFERLFARIAEVL